MRDACENSEAVFLVAEQVRPAFLVVEAAQMVEEPYRTLL